MIVIWENLFKVWRNFGNLIDNFKSFKEIFNKNLEKFHEILKFSYYRFSSFVFWKTFLLFPSPLPLEQLLLLHYGLCKKMKGCSFTIVHFRVFTIVIHYVLVRTLLRLLFRLLYVVFFILLPLLIKLKI